MSELLSSASVSRFVETVERYCTVIETLESFSTVDLLEEVNVLLPLIYAEAHLLPDVEGLGPPSESVAQRYVDSQRGSPQLCQTLQQRLGEHDRYSFVYDPFSPAEPIEGSLSDDLAQVYVQLKPGWVTFQNGDPSEKAQAVHQWRFGASSVWGLHATAAIRGIFQLVHYHLYDEDES